MRIAYCALLWMIFGVCVVWCPRSPVYGLSCGRKVQTLQIRRVLWMRTNSRLRVLCMYHLNQCKLEESVPGSASRAVSSPSASGSVLREDKNGYSSKCKFRKKTWAESFFSRGLSLQRLQCRVLQASIYCATCSPPLSSSNEVT